MAHRKFGQNGLEECMIKRQQKPRLKSRGNLLIKNITREGPGLLENLLTSHSIAFDLIDLNQGEKIPPLFSYDAIFVFGGPDSANDQTAKMSRELACVKEVLDHQIPYLGICL